MSVSAAQQRDVVGSTTTTLDIMVPVHNEDAALPGCVRVPHQFLRMGSDETVIGMGGFGGPAGMDAQTLNDCDA